MAASNRQKRNGEGKIFCIGPNKTGTTSLKSGMQELGYRVGNQRRAEGMVQEWALRDFSNLVRYCEGADFFQDFPFSKPYTYVVLDHEFPGSKFILTIRNSPEEWYDSLTRFHAAKWGRNGQIPDKRDLQRATYIYKGRPWHTNRLNYDTPEDDPYQKERLIRHYTDHIRSVTFYFRHRTDDLLVLNVAEENSWQKLCDFLGVTSRRTSFPWKNRTPEAV